MRFDAIGMKDLYQFPGIVINVSPTDDANLGRGSFTQNAVDNYKFKVPQLYNLKNSSFYGHGSSFTSVRDVIAYKNNAIMENNNVPPSQLASEFHPLNLTSEEIDQIADFVENALYDADLMRYQPAAVPSGNCIPNNDYQSKIDLGCQ
jgi:cytochrome c peroxidase